MSGKKRPAAKGGTRVSGRRASGQPAPPRDNPDHRSDQPVVVTVEPVGDHGQFRGNVGDRVVVASSRTPFLDPARRLLELGYDPNLTLEMWRPDAASWDIHAAIAAGKLQPKLQFEFSISSLALLSAPSTPETAVNEVAEQAKAGRKVTRSERLAPLRWRYAGRSWRPASTSTRSPRSWKAGLPAPSSTPGKAKHHKGELP